MASHDGDTHGQNVATLQMDCEFQSKAYAKEITKTGMTCEDLSSSEEVWKKGNGKLTRQGKQQNEKICVEEM